MSQNSSRSRSSAPRVGTTDMSAPQPEPSQSRDMAVSEPRRNPEGRSGRPSGPNALKHDGTQQMRRVARAGTSEEEAPTSRTRGGAAGRKTAASTPVNSASGATAKRTPPQRDSVGQPASPSAVAGARPGGSRNGARGASKVRGAEAATAKMTGLRPEGARGGHNRTPTRADDPTSSDTGRSRSRS